MAFREVRVYEVKEVLRLWLRGKGTRPISALVGGPKDRPALHCRTAEAGLERSTDEDALDDKLMAKVYERARPSSFIVQLHRRHSRRQLLHHPVANPGSVGSRRRSVATVSGSAWGWVTPNRQCPREPISRTGVTRQR